jgi:hypothetical protein
MERRDGGQEGKVVRRDVVKREEKVVRKDAWLVGRGRGEWSKGWWEEERGKWRKGMVGIRGARWREGTVGRGRVSVRW